MRARAWLVAMAAVVLGGCVGEVTDEGGGDAPPDEYSPIQPVCVVEGVEFTCGDDGPATAVSFDDGQGGVEPCTPTYAVPSCTVGGACYVNDARGSCKMVCLGPNWCRAE